MLLPWPPWLLLESSAGPTSSGSTTVIVAPMALRLCSRVASMTMIVWPPRLDPWKLFWSHWRHVDRSRQKPSIRVDCELVRAALRWARTCDETGSLPVCAWTNRCSRSSGELDFETAPPTHRPRARAGCNFAHGVRRIRSRNACSRERSGRCRALRAASSWSRGSGSRDRRGQHRVLWRQQCP